MIRWQKTISKLVLAACLAVSAVSVPTRADDYDTPSMAAEWAKSSATYRYHRKHYDGALDDMVKARKTFIADAYKSPEYKAAVKAVQESSAAYKKQQSSLADGLAGKDAKYQSVMKEREKVEADLEAFRQKGDTDIKIYTALYQKKSDLTRELQKMVDTAAETSGGNKLHAEWKDATAKLVAMKEDIVASAEKSQGVVEAKQRAAVAREDIDKSLIEIASAKAEYNEATARQNIQDYWNGQTAEWMSAHSSDYGNGYYGGNYWRR